MIKRILLFLILMCFTVNASFVFDSVTDWISVADNDNLTLPDHTITGGWTIAGWIKSTDNSGSYYQYFLSVHYNLDPQVRLWINEDSQGDPDEIKFYVSDSTPDDAGVAASTSAPISDTSWHHVILEHDGSNITLYVDATSVTSDTATLVNVVNCSTPWFFGQRSNEATANTDRNFVGKMAEWAMWERALTSTERNQLAGQGGETKTKPSGISTPTWYIAMDNDFTAGSYSSEIGSLTGTENGDVTFDSADHPFTIDAGGGSLDLIIVMHVLNLMR